jgi:hypothetical protein
MNGLELLRQRVMELYKRWWWHASKIISETPYEAVEWRLRVQACRGTRGRDIWRSIWNILIFSKIFGIFLIKGKRKNYIFQKIITNNYYEFILKRWWNKKLDPSKATHTHTHTHTHTYYFLIINNNYKINIYMKVCSFFYHRKYILHFSYVKYFLQNKQVSMFL